MKKSGIGLSIVLMLIALLLNISGAAAADGYYQLNEVSQPAWDGTTANRLYPPTLDYDYAYGDDESVSYNLPWNLQFYGRNYSGITADTNGNVWFNASHAAYDINLASTGRGPVISAWNSDLSSSYYGGVFIEHKENPERVVIEWNSETYSEEGYYSPNHFAVVLYPDGTVRFDYKSFSTENGSDSGSGISRGDGSASTNLTAQFGNVFMLAGRSFQFIPQSLFPVAVAKDGVGGGTITSDVSGINCGTICSGNFPPGSSLVLTAAPGFGSSFEGWSGACSGVGTCTITVDSAKTVTAIFAESYAPAVAIGSPSGTLSSATPLLSYQVSTGIAVVKLDGVIVNKISGDALDPLSDGQHVLRVESTNAAGHLGFAETSFTVDTTAPSIAKVIPGSGSRDVQTRIPVVVQFAEPVDPDTVTASTVSLAASGVPVSGDIRLASDGRTVIFKPQKLSYATSYVLTVKAGIRDVVGNATVSDITTTFSTPIIDSDIVGFWPMDGDWKDYSGAEHDGTAYGNATFTTGRALGELSANFVIDSAAFEGSGGFVPTTVPFIDGVADNFTMSFWAKPTATRETTTETNSAVVSGEGVQRFAIAPINMYDLGYLGAIAGVSVGTNGISVFEKTTSGGVIGYFPSLLVYDSPEPLTDWNYITVVYNGKQPSLYLNGTLVRTGKQSQEFEVYPSSVFAFSNESATGSYSGQLGKVVYYKRALTAQDVMSLYQEQSQHKAQISITSPGQNAKYRPGETGSAAISVASIAGVTGVYCSASGATIDGELALEFDQPQTEVTAQFSFTVAADAAPYAPIVLSCVASSDEGAKGIGELQLLAADLIPPSVVSTVPANNAVDVSATMPMTIVFSEAVDPASIVSRESFRVQRTDNGAWVTGMYRMSTDNRAIQFLPVPALDSATSYTITFSGVRDLAGNTLVSDYVLQFTTLQQTSLVIENQGTSSSPYVLQTGRYGTLSLKNSYVSVSGGVTADSVTIDHSTLNVSPAATVPGNVSVSYGDMTLTNNSEVNVNGTLNLSANLHVTNSTMTVTGSGTASGNVALNASTLTLNDQLEVAGNVSLQSNSILTHFAATETDTFKLDITAANLTVDATSKIDVTGKGYLGGYPDADVPRDAIAPAPGHTLGNTTSGGSYNNYGGSYGGHGGGSEVNAAYGDAKDPKELGSGGGGYYYDLYTGLSDVITRTQGGNGGGLIRLNVASLSLDGVIYADGGVTSASGGSGGGIYISAGNIYGSGSISAKGGSARSGANAPSGGGGGRIAIYYTSLDLPITNISVTGGIGSANDASSNGSAGTIYLKDQARNADLVVNNNNIQTNKFTPINGGLLGNVSIVNGAFVTIMTRGLAPTVSPYSLEINAETINIDAASKIDLTGKGYLGGYSPGNSSINGMTHDAATQGPTINGGSTKRSGGSYGGAGAAGEGIAAAVYGNLLQPSEPGSGGGGLMMGWFNPIVYDRGGNGGGLLKLTANALTVNGSILADGTPGTSYGGGGSGGGVWINVGTLSGTGIISAKGGTSTVSDGLGAGGGGGRIAIYYTTNSLPAANISAAGGKYATGAAAANNGGAGTIYLKDAARAKGDIIVNNVGVTTSNPTTVSGGDYGRVTVSGGAKTSVLTDISFDQDVTFTGSNLTFSGGITSTANLTFDGSSITVSGPVNVTNTLTLKNGSTLNHSAATATANFKLDVTAGTVNINDTSKIDVTGRGFLGGYKSGNASINGMTYDAATQGPTINGGSTKRSGGSYGGVGAAGEGTAAAVYGNLLQPSEPGSGGGGLMMSWLNPVVYDRGGNGGGLLKLTANALNLNGVGSGILADGESGASYGGGGSGGGVWINVGTLSGTGIISAKGGTSTVSDGLGAGGGGGRIAIYYTFNSLPAANISAAGGKYATGAAAANNGGAGTIYLKDAARAKGDVIVNNGGLVTSSTTTVSGGDYGQVTVNGGAKIGISSDISFDQDVTFTGSNLTFSGGITSTANLTFDGSSITVSGPVNVSNTLTLINGSTLYHSATSATAARKLDVTAGTISINDTSKIDVSGKGFLGGYQASNGNSSSKGMTYDAITQGPTTVGGSSGGSGGSYGGPGGYSGNALYGSIMQPNEPGSGGAGDGTIYSGANGGGVVKLTANVLDLNGIGTRILANGNGSPNYGGGGSGGAIWINVGTLSGTGIISAKGGTAATYGGGGGGRIAIYYDTNTLLAANITAAGGKSGTGGTGESGYIKNGGAGTIYLKDNAQSKGDLFINNGGVTASNVTTVAGGDYGQVTVNGGAKTSISSDISFDEDVTFTGSNLTFSGGITSTANLTFDGSSITVSGPVNVSNTLTLINGSTLYHSATSATAARKLDVTAGTISINDTSKIDVSGRGFLGGYQANNGNSSSKGMTYDAITQGPTTVGGSSGGSGGSYGGPGGYSGNALYGSIMQPNEPGSGGAGDGTIYSGANGGGVVKLTANVLDLNGIGTRILANGNGSPNYGGGGSGGAIWINVGTLSGTGSISAKGGTAATYGGGGGGRIAIYYDTNTLLAANITAAGGKSGTGGTGESGYIKNGGAGTIYLKDNAQSKGDLFINNGGVTASNVTSISGGDYRQANFTSSATTFDGGISTSANLTLDGSTVTVKGPVNVVNILTLQNGSLLTHSGATATVGYKLDVTAGTVNINDSSKMDVTGKGFLGGYQAGNSSGNGMTYDLVTHNPTTAGGSASAGGGSYGGLGGGSANALYGGITQPGEPGSGGAGLISGVIYKGANGGGVIKLTAGTLNLIGSIVANGSSTYGGNYGGGGSGGSIWIDAGVITGTGAVSAKGGVASSLAVDGGGGGGRVAIYYNTSTLPTANITAVGGKCGSGGTTETNYIHNGGAGTIYLKDNAKAKGDIFISNGGLKSGKLTTVTGGDYGQVSMNGAARIDVTGDISFDTDVTFTSATATFNGGISTSANLTLDGSTVSVNGPISVTNTVTLKNGSILSHSGATATTSYKLQLTAGTVNINDTSKIDVSGKGLLGGYPTGNGSSSGNGMTYDLVTRTPTTVGGSTYSSGGSYGGLGGGGTPNPVYGLAPQPNEPGSGGAGLLTAYYYKGASGGGVVKVIAGTLNLTGSIAADGSSTFGGNYGGGGSGGSVWIDAGTITGTGTVSAKGGTASSYTVDGGGGGGRIAVYYDANSLPAASFSAAGGKSGTGNDAAHNGKPGSVYLLQNVFPVTVSKTGAGTVQSLPSGIDCGATCSGNFAKSSTVVLTAVADAGHLFSGWSGACVGSNSDCTLVMDQGKAVMATFAAIPPPIISIAAPAGSLNSNRPMLQYSVNSGTVVVKVDGVVVQKVSGDLLDPLSEGSHILRIEANNGAFAYAESMFTIDTLAPSLTVTSLPALTKYETQILSGTVEAGGAVTVAVTEGGASAGQVTYPTQNSWTCTVTNLSLGVNSFTITAVDEARNSKNVVAFVTYALPISLELSVPAIAADSSETFSLQIGHIDPPGGAVLIEQFIDANRNGTIDESDYVVASFNVIDGITAAHPNMPGDEDGSVNGAATTTLDLSVRNHLLRSPGSYLFRATNSSDTVTATAPFAVTPVVMPQSVSGTVTDGDAHVAGALIRLLDKWGRPVTSTIADAAGNFVLEVPLPGDYLLLAVIPGLAGDRAGASVTVSANEAITNRVITLTRGSVQLSGKVKKDSSEEPVSGVWVKAVNDSFQTYAITGTDGSYNMQLPAGLYQVKAVADVTFPSTAVKGYGVPSISPEPLDLSSDVTGFDISLPPVTATVTGIVKDQLGVPVPGMPVTGMLTSVEDTRQPMVFAKTDLNGNFVLNLTSGSQWNISVDQGYAQGMGFIGDRFNLSAASLPAGVQLTVWPVKSWIRGVVTDSASKALENVDVQLRSNNESVVAGLTTAANGSYVFGVFGGDWRVDALYLRNGVRTAGEQAVALTEGETAYVDFVIDSVSPSLGIQSPVPGVTPDNTPLLVYSFDEGTALVKVDGIVVSKASGENLDPLANGPHTVVVDVIDAAGNLSSASVTFSVDHSPLALLPIAPADAVVSTAYSQQLAISGGVSPYTFSLLDGTFLPAGLLLDSQTSVIAGVPTSSTTAVFRIQAVDSDGANTTQQYTMSVYYKPEIVTASLPDGYLGTSHSQSLSGTGGKAPYQWSITNGVLPQGLTLDAGTGTITGVVNASAGTFTVQMMDANNLTAIRDFNIVVANGMTTAVAGNGGTPASGTMSATPSFIAGQTIPANAQTSMTFTTPLHS